MPSEEIMYISTFAIGILMFGFFSVSFNDFTTLAESTNLDSNLQQVIDEIGEKLIQMINQGQALQSNSVGTTNDIIISMKLQLESEFSNTPYTIVIGVDANDVAYLYAQADNNEYGNYTLGFVHDATGLNGINFSGTLISSSASTGISYSWSESTGVETITLSS
ncbi:MAG: hypothetical protein INQ03_08685 [Candidatus Heimdallarchaeota archaeon]|nr:hypothetical protein [Candidatus Heimdallarchaeota archaeon]